MIPNQTTRVPQHHGEDATFVLHSAALTSQYKFNLYPTVLGPEYINHMNAIVIYPSPIIF